MRRHDLLTCLHRQSHSLVVPRFSFDQLRVRISNSCFSNLSRFDLAFQPGRAVASGFPGLNKAPGVGPPAADPARTCAALLQVLTGWGHQTAWIGRRAAAALLLVVGFARVSRCPCVHGELEGVYGHHRDIGPELARLESTILEARKMKNLAGRNNLPPELVPVFDTHRRSFKGSPQRRPTAEFLL